jgi:hypothetical protein
MGSAHYAERDTFYWLQLLERSLSCPAISDYIFFEEWTPEQILEKAQSYKPLI